MNTSMIELVTQSKGDSAVFLNGVVIATSDLGFVQCAGAEDVVNIAQGLSEALMTPIIEIEDCSPPNEEWSWEEIAETLPSHNQNFAEEKVNTYNVFSNTGNWDPESIGFVATIEGDCSEKSLMNYVQDWIKTKEIKAESITITKGEDFFEELLEELTMGNNGEYFSLYSEANITMVATVKVSNDEICYIFAMSPAIVVRKDKPLSPFNPLNEFQESALIAAYNDMCGVYQCVVRDGNGGIDCGHDWDAHRQSIEELEEAFPVTFAEVIELD